MPQLSHDEAIDALRKLPEDQQRQALGRLSPDARNGIFAKLQSGAAPVAAAAATTDTPEPTPGLFRRAWNAINTPIGSHISGYNNETEALDRAQNFSETEEGRQAFAKHPILTGAKSVIAGLERDAADLLTPAFVATEAAPGASSAVEAALPGAAGAVRTANRVAKVGTTAAYGGVGAGQVAHAVADTDAPIEQRVQEGLGGAAALTGTAAEAGRTAGKLARPNLVRNAAQDMFGAGEQFQEKTAGEYAKKVQAVKDANQGSYEQTMKKRGEVDEANKDIQQKHLKKSVAQLKEDAQKIRDVSEKRQQIKTQNEETAQEHGEKVGKTLQERDAAEQTVGLRDQAAKDLQEKTDAYFAKEDATAERVKKDTDKVWEPFHEKAKNPVNVDQLATDLKGMTERNPNIKKVLQDMTPAPEDADPQSQFAKDRQSIIDAQNFTGGPGMTYDQLNPMMRDLVDKKTAEAGFEPDATPFDPEAGKTMSLEDVHRATSILGQRIANGGYEGIELGEAKQLLKKLNAARTRGAIEVGALDDLQKGVNATREYKDAFGRERNQKRTVIGERKEGANPDALDDREEQARLDAVAKHDPSLVEDYKGVQAAREHFKSFPDPEQLRKGLPTPPDRPAEKPLPELPTPRPLPEAPPLKQYAEPEAETPQTPVPNMQEQVRNKLNEGLRKYGRIGEGVARVAAGAAVGGLTHMSLTDPLSHMSLFGTDLVLGQAAVSVLSKALRSEHVLDWMSRPTSETIKAIEQVPPEQAEKLKQALTGLAMDDIEKGGRGKLDSRVARFIGPNNVALIVAAANAGTIKNAGDAKKRVAAARGTPNP